ncbi:MAG TPA: hypothetical protein VIF83_07275 [Gemmatimonadaceae bacterium]
MSEDPLHRVYVDTRPVDVARTATVIDAVAALDANLADQVRRGDRTVTDSRGLPIDINEPIFAGTILRTVKARADHS